jgi:threonine/homoserine/homoserine lactone efflux protein
MPSLTNVFAFAFVALGMVLTPGPNMIYLISRSIIQGRVAGLISLSGVALGFVVYMLCAALGLTALVFAVPYGYDAVRLTGAAYLVWLAWAALRPGGRSPFEVKALPVDSPRRLFAMGFLTNLLNPKLRCCICRSCHSSSISVRAACSCNRSRSDRRRLSSASP